MEHNKLRGLKTLGRVGYVITMIAFVLQIIALIALTVASAAVMFIDLPNHNIELSVHSDNIIQYDQESENYVRKVIDIIDSDLVDIDVESGLDGIVKKGDDISFDTNNNLINVKSEDTITFNLAKEKLKVFLPFGTLIISVLITYYMKEIFKHLRDGNTPFTEEMKALIHKLGILLILLILYPILVSLITGIYTTIYYGYFDVDISIDFIYIILILVVFALVKIFNYGVDLQNQYDETL